MKHPTTQKELAHLIGISPQAVSQGLADHPYVQRNDDGCYIEHTDATIDRWIDDYPGPGGATLYWYSLDAIVEQGHNVATLADELEVQALLSDDVAADDYAPWRLPATAIIYLREAVDFTVIDFMPTTRENATLIAKIPEDPTVWALGRTLTENPQRMLADPMLTLWDVTHSTGSDTDDAAEGLDYRVVGGHMIQLLLHAYPTTRASQKCPRDRRRRRRNRAVTGHRPRHPPPAPRTRIHTTRQPIREERSRLITRCARRGPPRPASVHRKNSHSR